MQIHSSTGMQENITDPQEEVVGDFYDLNNNNKKSCVYFCYSLKPHWNLTSDKREGCWGGTGILGSLEVKSAFPHGAIALPVHFLLTYLWEWVEGWGEVKSFSRTTKEAFVKQHGC